MDDQLGKRTGSASKTERLERDGVQVLGHPPYTMMNLESEPVRATGTTWKVVGPRKGMGFDFSALRR